MNKPLLIPAEYVELAKSWYCGSGSMLYAIASTGNLAHGSIRPTGDDGPMSDDEWYKMLWSDLESELYHTMKADNTGELSEFYAWVEKVIQEL